MAIVPRDEQVKLVEWADLPPGMPLSRASMIRVAQQSSADFLVFGSYSGDGASLQISLRVLDLHALKLGGLITANGRLSYLPQMENDLSWLILVNNGLAQGYSRAQHQKTIRTIPNAAYSLYISSLIETDEGAAAAALHKVVTLYPGFPEAHFLLGRHYFQQGDCAKAISHLSRVLDGGGANPEARFMSGNCFLLQGQFDLSVQQYAFIMSVGPFLEAANNLGVAYLRKGEHALSDQYLQKAREVAAGDPTVGLNLAILRFVEGNTDAALQVIEGSLKEHPSHGMLRYLYGVVLAKVGRAGESDEALAFARRLGIEPERLGEQDPKLWTRVFQSWKH
jgi:Flp pilus assembly protein TadD